MRYKYNRGVGFVTLGFVTAVFGLVLWSEYDQWDLKQFALFGGLYLLAATLLHFRYLHVAVRTDEQGLTVERAQFPKVYFAWKDLQVEYRKQGGRGASTGLLLERKGKDKPYFLPFKNMEDEQTLLEELKRRLGSSYKEVE